MSASPHVLTPSPASSDHGHSSSPQPSPSNAPLSALSQLSRNTSVISSSSSSSSLSLHIPSPPPQPQPQPQPQPSIPPSPRLPPRRAPGTLQLGPSTAWAPPRSPHGTPPATPRGDRSPLFGVPAAMLPRDRDRDRSEDRFGQRHMSIASAASAETTSTLRPSSRSSSVVGVPEGSRPQGVMPRDFEFGRELGTGSYSVVTAAYLPQNGQTYAIKALDKAHVLRYKQQGNKVDVQMERRALMRLSRPGHPGVVRLFWAMQDQASLYFVLELCPKGDMTTVLRRLGSFSLACARFYFAQITDAVMFIHSQGIVHRDLKPDNFLFTDQWRIKITDFGSAKIIEAAEESDTPAGSRRTSFVGSPQYVSPEILAHQAVSYPTDLWSMGIVLYQMISGHFPFDSGPTGGMAHYLMWQRVLKGEYSFGEGWDPQAQDLVKKLLVNEPGKRLGAQGGEEGAKELRKAPFFTPLDWASLWTSQVPAFEPGMYRREGPRIGDFEEEGEDEWALMLDQADQADSDEMSEAVEDEEEGEEHAHRRPQVAFPRQQPPIQASGKSSRSSSSSASSIPSLSTSRRTSATAATSISPHPSHTSAQSQPQSQPQPEQHQEPEKPERSLLSGPVLTRSILGNWTKERTLTLTSRRLVLTKGSKPRVEVALAPRQGDEDDVWAETRGPRMLLVHKGGRKWEFMVATPLGGSPTTPTRGSRGASPAPLPEVPMADRWVKEIAGAVLEASASPQAQGAGPRVRVHTPSTVSASPSTSRSGSLRGSAVSSRRSSRSRPVGDERTAGLGEEMRALRLD